MKKLLLPIAAFAVIEILGAHVFYLSTFIPGTDSKPFLYAAIHFVAVCSALFATQYKPGNES